MLALIGGMAVGGGGGSPYGGALIGGMAGGGGGSPYGGVVSFAAAAAAAFLGSSLYSLMGLISLHTQVVSPTLCL